MPLLSMLLPNEVIPRPRRPGRRKQHSWPGTLIQSRRPEIFIQSADAIAFSCCAHLHTTAFHTVKSNVLFPAVALCITPDIRDEVSQRESQRTPRGLCAFLSRRNPFMPLCPCCAAAAYRRASDFLRRPDCIVS